MSLNDLAKVIAKRNHVDSRLKAFTALDIAEYILIYKKQMEQMNQIPEEAFKTLFGDGVEENDLEDDLSAPLGEELAENVQKGFLEEIKKRKEKHI